MFNILGASASVGGTRLRAVFEGIGSPTLLCILGSRIILNLREALEHDADVAVYVTLGAYDSKTWSMDEMRVGASASSDVGVS